MKCPICNLLLIQSPTSVCCPFLHYKEEYFPWVTLKQVEYQNFWVYDDDDAFVERCDAFVERYNQAVKEAKEYWLKTIKYSGLAIWVFKKSRFYA
jgi:hypothetical protein